MKKTIFYDDTIKGNWRVNSNDGILNFKKTLTAKYIFKKI